MTKILVTGADGQLGREIKDIAFKYINLDFIFTDINNLDICNEDQLSEYVSENNVSLIINCAAYTDVDKAEEEIEAAMRINEAASKNLADVALKYNCMLIHISTDYVFDGTADQPYKEDHRTNPQSVYGRTKLAGEEAIISSNAEAIIIRTSWLYSKYGNNFVKTMLRFGQEREELGVVDDQKGSPTYAGDLAKAVLDIALTSLNEKLIKKGIYHYSNSGVCSWYEFALEIFILSGINCKVKPIRTEDYPTAAKRPRSSVMSKDKIINTYGITIPNWHKSLEICLNSIT